MLRAGHIGAGGPWPPRSNVKAANETASTFSEVSRQRRRYLQPTTPVASEPFQRQVKGLRNGAAFGELVIWGLLIAWEHGSSVYMRGSDV